MTDDSANPQPSPYTIRLATTQADRDAAFRLRYEVFTAELGDDRYADHEKRLFLDCDDDARNHLLIAELDDGTVIGTVRLTLLKDCRFIGYDAYGWDQLATVLGITLDALLPRVARLDRGAVAKPWRRTGILGAFQPSYFSICYREGCDTLVGTIEVHNDGMRKAMASFGWSESGTIETFNGLTAQVIYRQLPSTTTGHCGQ